MNTETIRAFIWARRIALLLALSLALYWLGHLMVRQARGGGETADAAQDGGVYLLKELVERAGYFNEWWAYPEGRGETEITIIGEGKLVEFRGSLRLDAEPETAKWHGAQNFGQAIDVAEIERLVPRQAIEKVWAWSRSR